MGNGLLLVVLGSLVLDGHGADGGELAVFALVLAAAFGLGFAVLVARPSEAVLGYKG